MAVTDEDRHRLRTRLEQVLGREEAIALMEHLPPVGWADVATKHDLALLELKLDTFESRVIGTLHREIASIERHLFFGFLAALTGFTALILGFG